MKDIRQQWKALAAERKVTTQDIAALCVYRSVLKTPDEDGVRTAIMQGYGKEGATKRLLKAFRPITNHVKLSNGSQPFGSMVTALRMVKHSEVYKWLDEEDQKKVYDLSIEISKERFQ